MRACLWIVVFLTACHTGQSEPGRPSFEPDELLRVRTTVAARVALSTRSAWHVATGQPMAASAPGEDTRWILAPEVITKVQHAMEDAEEPEEKQALAYLHAYLVGEALLQSTRELDERIGALSAAPIGDLGASLASVSYVLARTAEAPQRKSMMQATLVPLKDVQPLLVERATLERATAKSLRLGQRSDLVFALKHVTLASLRERAEHLLLTSEALYQSLLREVAERELAMPLRELTAADLPRLFNLATLPRPFAKGLLPGTLEQLGYAPAALPIRIDAAGPQASQRAACFPLQVPDDVRIVLAPQDSLADDAALLHELGHALHFAFTRAPTLELAVLGDGAVSEASAFLLESLLGNDAFLSALDVPHETRARLVPLMQWRRLAAARRLAVQVLLATQDHVMREDYRARMSAALGVSANDSADHFLLDADRNFYAADYFLGMLLAAQLENHFVERFGDSFFRRAEVNEILRGLWHQGQAPSANDVAVKITSAALSDEALLRRVAKSLATASMKTAEIGIRE